jgi:hypothetical protein
VADLGPIVLGLRASSPKTLNAYTSLVYCKGALVLRMLHFLLTHPGTGEDTAFFNMLKDFTARYAGRAATTEDFFMVASEHFRRSPLGMKYHMQNLEGVATLGRRLTACEMSGLARSDPCWTGPNGGI